MLYLDILVIKMLFSEMTEEQKDQFYKEQEARIEKLRRIRPWINLDKVETIKPKEQKKYDYWKFHRKPMGHPDNRKTI